MRVLSLFDGMSCGRLALERAGFPIEKYYASEIDKYAIQIAKKNYPDTEHLGSVVDVTADMVGDIDLLLAGSPCQGFSFAGKQLAFEDPRSKLFFEFTRLLEEVKPTYFLLENVKMKKEYQQVITDMLGVEPIEINSALLSAQNRKRLYWTNIPNVGQPEDKGIFLKDILENGLVDRDKSYCLDANYFKGSSLNNYLKKCRRQVVFNYSSSGRGNGIVEDRTSEAHKAGTLTATGYTNRSFTGVMLKDCDEYKIRKLTPIECERLQTVEDNFTEGVSNTQRYKMLGNGWTVDVIAHILEHIRTDI